MNLGQRDKPPTPLENITVPLRMLGREMAVANTIEVAAKVSVALSQSGHRKELYATTADLIFILGDFQYSYIASPIIISDANFDIINIDRELNFSLITFYQCIINKIEIAHSINDVNLQNTPRFLDCIIDQIDGAISKQDIPEEMLCGTTSVERFAGFTATNDAVMKSTLQPSVKVMLTILRKLFMQRGSGRQFSALRRGLPVNLLKYVDPIIALVKANGMADEVYVDRRIILVPNRTRTNDALGIINGPNTSNHPLIVSVRVL
jgi:hypothetical protein